jgi:2-deoxy-D-gluconate 3-dehydrogenase
LCTPDKTEINKHHQHIRSISMQTLDLFRLDQQVALVTGVSRGIGQALAVGLAEAGVDIAGLYHTYYEETQTQVESLGRRFLPIQCDLQTASVKQLNGVVEQVVQELGQLNILVNNAGTIQGTPTLEFKEQDWDNIMQVNLKSVFFLCRAAVQVMLRQGQGKIINIASMLSFQGGIPMPPYTASKSGVAGLTKALANEWASLGINVNAIAPGYIATDKTAPLRADPQWNSTILACIPVGRWGEPDELKGAVVFLASAASDYIHGAIVPVDGGWLAR